MKKLEAKYPNNDPIHLHVPTSSKDLKVLFLVHGINAWPAKIGGRWHILYGGSESPKIFNTGEHSLDKLSLKDWLEIVQKNMPEYSKCNPYDDLGYLSFFGWPNVKKYIQEEVK